MSALHVSDISQSAELVEGADPFDIVVGYANDDARSIRNLLAVAHHAHGRIVFAAEAVRVVQSTATARKKRALAEKNLAGFDYRVWDEGQAADIGQRLSRVAAERNGPVACFIDVSALPRTWLAAILYEIRQVVAIGTSVRVTLGYCIAQYTPPTREEAPPNRRVAPVHPGLAGWPRSPGLPVHLIVGLGYERGKALGAVEYLQPSQWRLFVPDSPDGRFIDQVRTQNRDLIDGTRANDRFDYQVLDPASQYVGMASMLRSMVAASKPVLLPFGPKIFFAVCVLLALQFPEVSVWHVSGEEQTKPAHKKPSDMSVFFSFLLSAPAEMPVDELIGNVD